MKTLKRVYGWILLSVLLQTTILAYFNYIYLPGRGAFRATAYEAQTAAIKNRSYNLPDGSSNVKVSNDGLYAAYMVEDRLELVDLDSKKVVKKLDPSGGSFSYFRWLPDRDMLIYTIKEPDGKSGCVRISTYDIGPELDRSYPDIVNLPVDSTVIDLQLSPLTNIVYPLIQTSDTRVRIYQFDIMDDLELIMKADLGIIIRETMYEDNLIYQPAGGKIVVRNGRTGKKTSLPVKEASLLLSVDDTDFVYAASTDEGGKITAIHFGKIGQKAQEWQSIKPTMSLAVKDIFISPQGSVYAADRQRKTVLNLKDGGSVEYQGELLTVTDNYVVSTQGSKLTLRVIKK